MSHTKKEYLRNHPISALLIVSHIFTRMLDSTVALFAVDHNKKHQRVRQHGHPARPCLAEGPQCPRRASTPIILSWPASSPSSGGSALSATPARHAPAHATECSADCSVEGVQPRNTISTPSIKFMPADMPSSLFEKSRKGRPK